MAPVLKILELDANKKETVEGTTDQYPYTMHRTDYSQFSVPWHWHEEIELTYQARGSIDIITNNRTYTVREGEALFMNSNVLSCKQRSEGCTDAVAYEHQFHPVLLCGHFHSVYETLYVNPIIKNPQIEAVFFRRDTKIGREALKKLQMLTKLQEEERVELQTRNLLSEIWLLTLQEIQENGTGGTAVNLQNQERIRCMMTYIHQHYMEKLTVESIAASADVSERECLRCFQKNLGRTPFDYIIEYRLGKAKQFLASTEDSITDVALSAGFSGSAYFGKKFREFYGMTPGAFRRKHGKI
jgi:AraC-like DNA-binding protein